MPVYHHCIKNIFLATTALYAIGVNIFARGGKIDSESAALSHHKNRKGEGKKRSNLRSLQNTTQDQRAIIEDIFIGLGLPFNSSNIQDVCTLRSLNCTDGIVKEFIVPYEDAFGTIPSKFGLLSSLEILSVGGSNLKGKIPTELSALSNLTELYLYGSNIIGTLPTHLGLLKNLKKLKLGGNKIGGTFITEIGSLIQLESLGLVSNNIRGTIPTELGKLNELKILTLSVNWLTGTLPTELGAMESLGHLEVSFNRLTGTVPLELANMKKLTVLDLTHTDFDGDVSHLCAIKEFNYDLAELTGDCRCSSSRSQSIINKITAMMFPLFL